MHRWESGPYTAAFSLNMPDMLVNIAKICARSPIVSIKPVFRCRTPKSDRLLDRFEYEASVGTTEPERIRQRDTYLHFPRRVGNEVEVTLGILLVQINRWRCNLIFHSECQKNAFDTTCGTKQMPGT